MENISLKIQAYLDKEFNDDEVKIQDDGSINLWFNSKYHSKSTYPIAQLIRLKILVAKLDGSSLDETIRRLESFLLSRLYNQMITIIMIVTGIVMYQK